MNDTASTDLSWSEQTTDRGFALLMSAFYLGFLLWRIPPHRWMTEPVSKFTILYGLLFFAPVVLLAFTRRRRRVLVEADKITIGRRRYALSRFTRLTPFAWQLTGCLRLVPDSSERALFTSASAWLPVCPFVLQKVIPHLQREHPTIDIHPSVQALARQRPQQDGAMAAFPALAMVPAIVLSALMVNPELLGLKGLPLLSLGTLVGVAVPAMVLPRPAGLLASACLQFFLLIPAAIVGAAVGIFVDTIDVQVLSSLACATGVMALVAISRGKHLRWSFNLLTIVVLVAVPVATQLVVAGRVLRGRELHGVDLWAPLWSADGQHVAPLVVTGDTPLRLVDLDTGHPTTVLYDPGQQGGGSAHLFALGREVALVWYTTEAGTEVLEAVWLDGTRRKVIARQPKLVVGYHSALAPDQARVCFLAGPSNDEVKLVVSDLTVEGDTPPARQRMALPEDVDWASVHWLDDHRLRLLGYTPTHRLSVCTMSDTGTILSQQILGPPNRHWKLLPGNRFALGVARSPDNKQHDVLDLDNPTPHERAVPFVPRARLGQTLLVGQLDGKVVRFNMEDGSTTTLWPLPPGHELVSVSPSGRYVVASRRSLLRPLVLVDLHEKTPTVRTLVLPAPLASVYSNSPGGGGLVTDRCRWWSPDESTLLAVETSIVRIATGDIPWLATLFTLPPQTPHWTDRLIQ